MQYSQRILDLLIMLDSLETVEDFKKDGGNLSSVKEKRLDDKLVVMKKIKKGEENSIMITKLFFREAINQILAGHTAVLPIAGWNFFHYSDSCHMFIYRHSLATDFCDGGTLGSNLLKIKANKSLTQKQIQTQQYLYTYGIARGMKHLFESKLIHRDLKTENIFVYSPKWKNDNVPNEVKPLIDSKYFVPLLADLGLAKFTIDGKDHSNNTYGTPLYEAPEQIGSTKYSFPADVYGYGVTLSDIFQLRKFPVYPSKATRNIATFSKYVKSGNKPDLGDCTANQKDYLMQLLDLDPNQRPNFIKIVDYLESPFKDDTNSTQIEGFIFNDLDIDVIKAYKNFIDLTQPDTTFKRTDEEFYRLKINEPNSSIKTAETDNRNQPHEIGNYISLFLNSIPMGSQPDEFYYKEGLQYELQKDYQNAKVAYMRAAIFGSLESVTKLGILLLKSSSKPKQIQGFNLLKLSADFKEKDGLYSFAYLLTEGFKPINVEPDLKTAAKLFTQAAELGHQKGWFMAGSIYHQLAFEENEKGDADNAKNNLEKAKDCYQKSSQEFNDKEAEALAKDISKCLKNI